MPAHAQSMIGGGKIVGMKHEERRASKKHLKRVSIERATNGGYSVSHDYVQGNGGPYVEADTYAFGADDHEGLMTHIRKHMGINRKKPKEGSAAEEARESKAEAKAEGD